MILEDARQVALDLVTRALEDELRDDSPLIAQRAENLVAIAVEHAVPIESLLAWIHQTAPHKQWSAAEWRRYCLRYREAQLELRDAQNRAVDPREAECR